MVNENLFQGETIQFLILNSQYNTNFSFSLFNQTQLTKYVYPEISYKLNGES